MGDDVAGVRSPTRFRSESAGDVGQGVRRGEGKPASLYELTAEAERLFPKAHAPVLSQLLTVLEERTSSDDMTAAMGQTASTSALGEMVNAVQLANAIHAGSIDV